jgi:hypothetical protein
MAKTQSQCFAGRISGRRRFMIRRIAAWAIAIGTLCTVASAVPASAQVGPLSLAERDIAAENAGDVTAALALYTGDAIVQNGGLCWTPCVGQTAIRKELERRVAGLNRPTIVAKYVSGNVAVVKTEVRLATRGNPGVQRKFDWSPGVERIVVWNVYEEKQGKIAVVTLIGQRTDPETARFIQWRQSWERK